MLYETRDGVKALFFLPFQPNNRNKPTAGHDDGEKKNLCSILSIRTSTTTSTTRKEGKGRMKKKSNNNNIRKKIF